MGAITSESAESFVKGWKVTPPSSARSTHEATRSANVTVLSHLAGRFTIQTENLASEALAFILKRSSAARRGLSALSNQCCFSIEEELSFETQLSNDDGSRPDIIGKTASGEVRLLLEAKFWAGLTESQPVGYLASFPSSGGNLLLFVAPERRLHTLWAELIRRVLASGTEVQPSLKQVDSYVMRVNSNYLSLVSWSFLLATLIRFVDQSGDAKTVADLSQLVGLCDQMDANAFLPLTSEELTSTLGQRVLQFCDLANVLTERLVIEQHGNTQGLRTSGSNGSYSRYLWLKGYGTILQFSPHNWAKWSGSPLWLGVKGENWKRSPKVRDALLRATIEFHEDEEHEYCFVPIYLTTGAEQAKVIEDAYAQIMRVVVALPPAVSTKPSDSLNSQLPLANGEEPISENTVAVAERPSPI